MAEIKSLYKDYFQKSRIFLYPKLDIKKGVSVTPVETYINWKNNYDFNDMKLCCLYHLRNDDEFRNFEKSKLINNKYFHDFKQVEDNKGVYVFDFSQLKYDWKCFVGGKYSQMTPEHKKCIHKFIGESEKLPYIDSFLNPDKYFKHYAEMINVKEKLLREVGELCDPPNIERETLIISVKNLELTEEKL